MRVLAAVAVAVLLGCGGWVAFSFRPPAPPESLGRDVALARVTVVNPGHGRESGRTIELRGGAIAAVRAAARDEDAGAFDGAFVLPGLIDLHTHLPPDNLLKLGDHFALLHVAHGVTTIRDVGDLDGTAIPAARRSIAEGRIPWPRLFACGPFVAGPAPPRAANTVIVHRPEEAASVVRSLRDQGFDCVKAYDDLSRESLRALVAEATRAGLPVLGHVPTAIAYEEALLPNPQHFFGVPDPASLDRDHIVDRATDWESVDDARMARIVAVTIEHDLTNTPTLVSTARLLLFEDITKARRDPAVLLLPRLYRDVVWDPHEGIPLYRNLPRERFARIRLALDRKMELVRRLHEAGARLYLGTDSLSPFVVPGAALHQEMRLFAEAGIPVERVWEIATREAGAALGVPSLGIIAPGAPADLLVFREDPTRDLAALDSLEAVVLAGRLYAKRDLDAAIAHNLAHYEGVLWDQVSITASRRLLARTVQRDY